MTFTYASPKSVVAVGILLPLLATCAVVLRFYTRRVKRIEFLVDDWLILPALFLTIGLGVTLIVGSALKGLGQPTPPPGPGGANRAISDRQILVEKVEFTFQATEKIALGFTKLSVVFFYRRIFCGTAFDIASKALLVIIGLWSLGFFITDFLECGRNFWALFSTLENLLTKCFKTEEELQAYVISDIIIDVLILGLPLPMIWGLHLPRRKKAAISCAFLLGFLTIAAGVTRTAIFFIANTNAFQDDPKNEIISVVTVTLYWSMIEVGLAVVAACLPTLRPLFASLSSSLGNSNDRSKPSRPSLPLSGNLLSPPLSPKTPDGGSTSSRSPFISSPWGSFRGIEKMGKDKPVAETYALNDLVKGGGLRGTTAGNMGF